MLPLLLLLLLGWVHIWRSRVTDISTVGVDRRVCLGLSLLTLLPLTLLNIVVVVLGHLSWSTKGHIGRIGHV